MRWDKVAALKVHGGLGFRVFKSFNFAILEKLWWKLDKFKASLVARVLEACSVGGFSWSSALAILEAVNFRRIDEGSETQFYLFLVMSFLFCY